MPRELDLYQRVRRVLSNILIDRRLGVETSELVELEELGFDPEDRGDYLPSGWVALRRALRHESISREDVFVDVGSGKGRILLQAARYPFDRVIGIELSETLNEVARKNLDANAHRLRCDRIDLITGDATEVDIPDDVTVAYLYNPVRAEGFAAVIDNLLASLDRRPRRLLLIYRSPFEHSQLQATGRFRAIRTIRGIRPWSTGSETRVYVAS